MRPGSHKQIKWVQQDNISKIIFNKIKFDKQSELGVPSFGGFTKYHSTMQPQLQFVFVLASLLSTLPKKRRKRNSLLHLT